MLVYTQFYESKVIVRCSRPIYVLCKIYYSLESRRVDTKTVCILDCRINFAIYVCNF